MRANIILLLDDKPETKTEAKPEIKSKTKSEAKTEAKSEAKSDVKSESATEEDTKVIHINNHNLGNAHTEAGISNLLTELQDKSVRIECDTHYLNKNELVAVFIAQLDN